MKTIAIFGATSGIAEQAARFYAAEGHSLVLVGRNEARLQQIASDLTVRGASASTVFTADLADEQSMATVVGKISEQHARLDVTWICHGTLPDEPACRKDPALVGKTLQVNGLSPVMLGSQLMNQAQLQLGKLVILSSVAGDIGRPSIATYGSAKAMVTAYFEALHRDDDASLPEIYLIKPGVVKTPMTQHLEHGALSADADAVAKKIKTITEKKSPGSYYVPGIWALIMLIVKRMPAFVLRRL